MPSEIILFGHGSKNTQWLEAFHDLTQHIRQAMHGKCLVSAAFLQFIAPTLDDAVREAASRGITILHVLPIFLFPGQHVNSDIPNITSRLSLEYPELHIELAPPVGAHDSFRSLVTDRAAALLHGKEM